MIWNCHFTSSALQIGTKVCCFSQCNRRQRDCWTNTMCYPVLAKFVQYVMKILANSTSCCIYPRDLFSGMPNAHWQHTQQTMQESLPLRLTRFHSVHDGSRSKSTFLTIATWLFVLLTRNDVDTQWKQLEAMACRQVTRGDRSSAIGCRTFPPGYVPPDVSFLPMRLHENRSNAWQWHNFQCQHGGRMQQTSNILVL